MLIFILDGMPKGWKEVNWQSNAIIIVYIRLIVVNYIGTTTFVIIFVSQIYSLQLHALHSSCNYLHGFQNNLAILALALFRLLILFFSKLWFKHSYSLLPGSKTNRRAKGSRQLSVMFCEKSDYQSQLFTNVVSWAHKGRSCRVYFLF